MGRRRGKKHEPDEKGLFSKLRIEQNTYEFFDLQKMQKQTQQPRQKEET